MIEHGKEGKRSNDAASKTGTESSLQADNELRESEEKYRVLFDQFTQGIYLHDIKGRVLDVNQMACAQSGYSREEWLGRTVFDGQPCESTINPPKAEILKIWSQWAPGQRSTVEAEHRRKDGTVYPVEISTGVVRYGDADVMLAIVKDITERKRAEEALRVSLTKYQTLFESFPLGITVSDKAGNILEANSISERLVGIPQEEHTQRDIDGPEWRIVRPDGTPLPPGEYASVRALKEQRRVENVEMGIVKQDGSTTWISVTAAPIPLEGYGVVVTYGDITERKTAEEKLSRSESKFRAAFLTSPDSVNINRLSDGLYLEINNGFTDIMGYTPEDVIGKTSLELNIWDDPADRERLVQGLRAQGYVVNLEARFRHKDGTIRHGLMSARVVELDGESCILSITRDITDRKRAEEEKEKLQIQLAQAQKMESVGRLAGGVAHDFNNMLNVILGHTEMALERLDPAQPLYADLQEVRKAAERSADLTRQLLAFARKQTVAPKVIDLNNTIASMLKMLQRLIGEDIDLVWLPGKDLDPVKMDPSQIDQIMANLCVNARDAIAGVGRVTIETSEAAFDEAYCSAHAGFTPGDYVMLAVSDDGCGMDAETLGHLFEPFFTTKEMGRGTGLGLAMVYGAVRQNSGFINVYSEPGQGTTFKIYLPLHKAKAQVRADAATAGPAKGGHETILLVEDEPAILTMTTMMLESMGYDVIGAKTPGEAIRLAREHTGRIDLLMTDVVLPEMNGRDLAGNLLSIYPGIKRLFMSGYTADVIAHHGVLEEGVNFIQKPFSMKDLAAKLRGVLDRE